MRLAVAVVDGTQAEESIRTWVREDVPLVVVSASDPVALSRWSAGLEATHVAVLTRPETHRAAKLQVTIAAGQHPEIAYCVLEREVSLLAMAVCGMTVLEGGAGSSETVSQLQSLLATTDAGVWLRRVNKLHSPPPGFSQHVRSMLPGGSGYVATMSPERTVTSSMKLSTATGTDGRHFVCEDTEVSGGREVLARYFGSEANTLPPLGSTAARYGAQGIEYARLGRDDALTTRTCPVCSLVVAGDVCPFCRARLENDSQETA